MGEAEIIAERFDPLGEFSQLYNTFEQFALEVNGIECWSARELQELLGYKKWENFSKVIDKAKEACINVGNNVSDHFPDVRKMVGIGSGAERDIDDILLTRYACYLVAQNGDSRKEQIAFAQTYFAVQTRKAELIEKRILELERVKARATMTQEPSLDPRFRRSIVRTVMRFLK